MEIHLIFTKNNQLKISITNNVNQSLDLKFVFLLFIQFKVLMEEQF
jgi:hypothetical protein